MWKEVTCNIFVELSPIGYGGEMIMRKPKKNSAVGTISLETKVLIVEVLLFCLPFLVQVSANQWHWVNDQGPSFLFFLLFTCAPWPIMVVVAIVYLRYLLMRNNEYREPLKKHNSLSGSDFSVQSRFFARRKTFFSPFTPGFAHPAAPVGLRDALNAYQ
jgi:hypothetical protein